MGTIFLLILNQLEFHLAQNWKKNYHHDHIPFNLKGNENIVLSVHGFEFIQMWLDNWILRIVIYILWKYCTNKIYPYNYSYHMYAYIYPRRVGKISCVISTGMPAQNAATILKPLVPNPFFIWCNMLLTGLHHSPVISIPHLFPLNSSILPLHLPSLSPLCARELETITITNICSTDKFYLLSTYVVMWIYKI